MSKVEVINNFDEFISSGVVVVDFWATWCGPCRMLAPVLDGLSEQMQSVKFGKLDVDENNDIAIKYQVSAIPNVCVFKNGELVDRSIGLVGADALQKLIEKHI